MLTHSYECSGHCYRTICAGCTVSTRSQQNAFSHRTQVSVDCLWMFMKPLISPSISVLLTICFIVVHISNLLPYSWCLKCHFATFLRPYFFKILYALLTLTAISVPY
jgi:hypothetical protein